MGTNVHTRCIQFVDQSTCIFAQSHFHVTKETPVSAPRELEIGIPSELLMNIIPLVWLQSLPLSLNFIILFPNVDSHVMTK